MGRNHGRGIMGEESWGRNHVGSLCGASGRSSGGALGGLLEGLWEASGRHLGGLGGIWEASGRLGSQG